jgi:hypothetical protein
MPGDSAKTRAATLPLLEWQGELDSALAELDDRLTHPRRRASDSDRQAVLPAHGHVPITAELLDEIAWRVAQQIRQSGETTSPAALTQALTVAPTPPAAHPAPPRPPLRSEAVAPALRPGKMLLIRFKLPLLPWPFRLLQRRHRKKQHPLTTARLRA